MAEAYSADNERNPWNAYYERPAMQALVGRVAGLDVLEAGCGSGPLTEWLVAEGARVVAFDSSAEMVGIARGRVDGRTRVLVWDLGEPLGFAGDAGFDLVVASLVMHYLERWEEPLREFARVLRPGGRVVFSTHHPAMDWQFTPDDYFAVREVVDVWRKGGREFEVRFWRRPLAAMMAAIGAAGLVVERLVEPEPLAALASVDPRAYERLRTRPAFLFFSLGKR